MAAPVDSLLVAIIDDLAAELGRMGRERGFRRDYSRVVRHLYSWTLEDDLENPQVQVMIGGTDETEESNDQYRHREEVAVQVHVGPEERDDGTMDLIRPAANVRADIFQALMLGQEKRHRGTTRGTTYHERSEAPDIGADEESIGATVREIYSVEWDHSSSGMDTEP
jgi:hypothetical protein